MRSLLAGPPTWRDGLRTRSRCWLGSLTTSRMLPGEAFARAAGDHALVAGGARGRVRGGAADRVPVRREWRASVVAALVALAGDLVKEA